MTQTVICPHCQVPVTGSSNGATWPITCPACAESIEQSMVANQSKEWVEERVKTEDARAPAMGAGQASATAPKGNDVQAVMDVVTGVNLRWKDNLIQGAVIAVTTLLGAPIGALVAKSMHADLIGGAVMGAFGGLLVGLFGSGIVLMIYRLFRH